MKKIFSIFLILSISLCAVAQERTISGRLMDEEQIPVDYATVILQKSDSTYVTATITDSLGYFSFRSELASFRLIFQHILYETIEIESSKSDLGTIWMMAKDNALDAIVVTAERPLVKVNDGVLEYDVQQVTQNKAVSNIYDAILELPGVREEDGSLTLAGASTVTVIMNGRPTTMSSSQLMQLLKQMPVSQVKKAEVMYSAPPQYHVRGAAINLVIDNMNQGAESSILQGEVRAGYTQRYYSNYSTGVSLLYSADKISADFLYSFSDIKTKTGLDLISRHNVGGTIHTIEQNNNGNSQSQNHIARLGLDYKLNEKSLLSLVYNTSVNVNGKGYENSTGTLSNSSHHKEGSNQLHNIALDLTSGFGMKAGLNYTYYNSPATSTYYDDKDSGDIDEYTTESQQNINSVLLYIDQEHKLVSDWKLSYGAKFNYARDHDYQRYYIAHGGDELYDTDSTIDEYIYDVYIGAGKSFSQQLSMNFSLTGEYYNLAGDDEWAIFPQAQLTYMKSPKNIFQFSFSSNKIYPSYWEKQDYKANLNGYAQVYGNPGLKPYNSYSAQLSYIKNQKYIFVLYYSYLPGCSMQLAYQSTEKLALIYQTQNWDYDQRLGANIIIPFSAGRWLSSRVILNGFYQRSKFDGFYDIGFDNKKLIGYAKIDNTFNISSKPNIKLNLSAYYMTNPIQGAYDLSSVWCVDAGAKLVFAGDRAELNIRALNIFDSSTPEVFLRNRGQNMDMYVLGDTRAFNISLSYKFGGYKEKQRKEVDKSRFGH